MRHKIIYKDNGDRQYFLNDCEVGEEAYKRSCEIEDGNKLKDMLQSQHAPHGISDCTFMRGQTNGSQFEGRPDQGDFYKSVTESMGGNTNGKKYLSGLARFPGDPEAWVNSRGDAQAVLEKRGWGSEGTINVKPRESTNPPTPGPEVADDLLEKYTDMIADNDPNPHLVDRVDLKEQVKDRIKPKRRPKEVTKAD